MDSGEEEVIRSLQNLELQTGGHRRLQLFVQLVDAGVHFRGVGARSLEYHVDGTGFAVDVGGEVIAHSADFHVRYIAQVQHVSAVAGAQHDVVELLDGFERTLVLQRVLVSVLALLTQRTRGSDKALSADGREHVVRFQTVLSHHIGFQPDTQCVGVTECHHVAHAGDTHQAGTHVDVDVVGDEVGIVLAVNALQCADVQDIALLLHHLHAHLRHFRRQQCRGSANAVLHVHRSKVRVGALFEIDLDGDIARGGC